MGLTTATTDYGMTLIMFHLGIGGKIHVTSFSQRAMPILILQPLECITATSNPMYFILQVAAIITVKTALRIFQAKVRLLVLGIGPVVGVNYIR